MCNLLAFISENLRYPPRATRYTNNPIIIALLFAVSKMASAVINKLNLFFKNIYIDYYEVFKEVQKGARARPLKASVYGGLIGFTISLFALNEDIKSFTSDIVSASNRLALVEASSKNPKSLAHITHLRDLEGHGLLRQVDLGFATLIYKASCHQDSRLYKCNCDYLRPTIKEFATKKFVDLGIMGHWLQLENSMYNYDINEEYLSHSLAGGTS